MKRISSLRVLRLSILSSMLALVGMFLLAVGTPAFAASSRDGSVIPEAGAPITTITHTRQGLAFNPSSIQIFLAHTNAIEVINSTKHAQTVLDANGHVVLKLAPGASNNLTFSQTGTFVYHLKGHTQVMFTAIVS